MFCAAASTVSRPPEVVRLRRGTETSRGEAVNGSFWRKRRPDRSLLGRGAESGVGARKDGDGFVRVGIRNLPSLLLRSGDSAVGDAANRPPGDDADTVGARLNGCRGEGNDTTAYWSSATPEGDSRADESGTDHAVVMISCGRARGRPPGLRAPSRSGDTGRSGCGKVRENRLSRPPETSRQSGAELWLVEGAESGVGARKDGDGFVRVGIRNLPSLLLRSGDSAVGDAANRPPGDDADTVGARLNGCRGEGNDTTAYWSSATPEGDSRADESGTDHAVVMISCGRARGRPPGLRAPSRSGDTGRSGCGKVRENRLSRPPETSRQSGAELWLVEGVMEQGLLSLGAALPTCGSELPRDERAMCSRLMDDVAEVSESPRGRCAVTGEYRYESNMKARVGSSPGVLVPLRSPLPAVEGPDPVVESETLPPSRLRSPAEKTEEGIVEAKELFGEKENAEVGCIGGKGRGMPSGDRMVEFGRVGNAKSFEDVKDDELDVSRVRLRRGAGSPPISRSPKCAPPLAGIGKALNGNVSSVGDVDPVNSISRVRVAGAGDRWSLIEEADSRSSAGW